MVHGCLRRSRWIAVLALVAASACSPVAVVDGGGDASDAAQSMDAMDAFDSGAVDAANEAAVDVPVPRDPLTWPVTQPGPYAVGYRTFMHTYMPAGSTTPRTIPIGIWYPTLQPNTRHPRYLGTFLDRDSSIDAPPADPIYPRGYPVHVHSHGHRGFGATSSFLMRYFASHGWIAIAPDHVTDTLADGTDPAPIAVHHQRVQDIMVTLDTLAALPDGDPLAHHADTARVLLSGHSFGTETTWALSGAHYDVDQIRAMCLSAGTCTEADLTEFGAITGDPRIVAAIPMAGAINRSWFGADAHTTVHIPLFAMSGTADPVGAQTQFDTTIGVDLTWIDVTGGCHQFFALGGCTDIPDSLQPVIVGAYALAMGRRHVLGDTDATVAGLLDGTIPVSDRVTFHRRSQ